MLTASNAYGKGMNFISRIQTHATGRKLLVFAVVLVVGIGMALWLDKPHPPSATIQFTQASLDTNGELILAYSHTQSAGTLLRDIQTEGGSVSGEGDSGASSWLGLRISGHGSMTVGFYKPPTGALLVQTGKTYTVDYNHSLLVYDFTNAPAGAYRCEFRLQPLP